MRKRGHKLNAAGVSCCLLITLLAPGLIAQSEKFKREKFGSSLKRLKWDDRKQAAVETKKNRSTRPLPATDADTLKLETLYVAFDILVSDPVAARFVTGLTKDDFIIAEDDQPQAVELVSRGDDAERTRSLVLVLDYSGSQLPFLAASISAAKSLIQRLAPADRMAIVTADIELLVDFTGDKARLSAALDGLEKQAGKLKGEDRFGRAIAWRRGRTLQFSALFAALRELVNDDEARHLIIFQSDGDEAVTFRDQPHADDYLANMPERAYGLQDIYAAAEKSRATIYTVIPSERLTGLPPAKRYERGRGLLERIERARFANDAEYQRHARIFPLNDAKAKLYTDRFAEAQQAALQVAERTGGWAAFLESPERAQTIYEQILTDINHRYVVAYYPTNAARDGNLRRVKITVRDHPEYRVHGRTSYYAPTAP